MLLGIRARRTGMERRSPGPGGAAFLFSINKKTSESDHLADKINPEIKLDPHNPWLLDV